MAAIASGNAIAWELLGQIPEAAVAMGRSVGGILAWIEREAIARIAKARRRRETAPIHVRLEWLTRSDWWPPADATEPKAEQASAEADDQEHRADEQAEALKVCNARHIPREQIALIGERARDRVAANEFRRKALPLIAQMEKRWRALRKHGAAVVEAIDQLIVWTRVSPEERAAVHTTMTLLRGLWPELQALSTVLPQPDDRTGLGGFQIPKGRPSQKAARDEADAKLKALEVPLKARARLLSAWRLERFDESRWSAVE